MKKKSKSILAVIVAILLLIVVIVTLTTNILFSRSDTPKIFGHYIYLMETDVMEADSSTETADTATASGVTSVDSTSDSENQTASIHQYTAVIAPVYDSTTDQIAKNNAVLCVLADDDTSTDADSDCIAVRRIYNIEEDSAGVLLYYPTTMKQSEVGTEPAITIDNILGKCTVESSELYSFITFVTSISGILLMLVLPCVILVIMLIVVIVRANSRANDEYAFEENYDEVFSEDSYDDDDDPYDEELGQTAFYQPRDESNSSFAQCRSSIAENFERKAVNPNSPYQKARTMQFKAQRDIPIYTGSDSQTDNDTYRGSATSDYEGSHNVDAQDVNNSYRSRNSRNAVSYAADTPISSLPTSDGSSYHGSHEANSPDEARNLRTSRSSTTTRNSTYTSNQSQQSKPTTSSSATKTSTGKNKYENASVDELLAMIEEEKNKLK